MKFLLFLLPLALVLAEYWEEDLYGLSGECGFEWMPKFECAPKKEWCGGERDNDFDCDWKEEKKCGGKPNKCDFDFEMPKFEFCEDKAPVCKPMPKPKVFKFEKECEAEEMEKCARDQAMKRKQAEKELCEADMENARCAEKESKHAKKADASQAFKTKKAMKAGKERNLDEVQTHKLNDKSDMAEECEDEGFAKSRKDILDKERQAAKNKLRKANKAKQAQSEEECLDADEKAFKMAKRAARKKAVEKKLPKMQCKPVDDCEPDCY